MSKKKVEKVRNNHLEVFLISKLLIFGAAGWRRRFWRTGGRGGRVDGFRTGFLGTGGLVVKGLSAKVFISEIMASRRWMQDAVVGAPAFTADVEVVSDKSAHAGVCKLYLKL